MGHSQVEQRKWTNNRGIAGDGVHNGCDAGWIGRRVGARNDCRSGDSSRRSVHSSHGQSRLAADGVFAASMMLLTHL
jgi:hypothetical protein